MQRSKKECQVIKMRVARMIRDPQKHIRDIKEAIGIVLAFCETQDGSFDGREEKISS